MHLDYPARMAFYDEHYEVIAANALTGPRKIHLGKSNPQSCRFCRKQAPAITFRKIAHTFPELIGNRFLISCDECDTCNELFSRTLEDNYAKFTTLQRVASRVKGKSGVPTFKSKDERTRWEANSAGAEIKADADGKAVQVDLENKRMTFTAVRQPHYPRFVFKCLVKMALAVMPVGELQHFGRALDWLQLAKPGDDPYNLECLLLHSMVNGAPPFQIVRYFLLRRKSVASPVPHFSFVVMWGNYIEQIFLPLSDSDKHLTDRMTLPYFPNPFDQPGAGRKVTHHQIDLSSLERKTDATHSVTFVMDSIEKATGAMANAALGRPAVPEANPPT